MYSINQPDASLKHVKGGKWPLVVRPRLLPLMPAATSPLHGVLALLPFPRSIGEQIFVHLAPGFVLGGIVRLLGSSARE